MHIPNGLILVQCTSTYSPTLDMLCASYDQTISITMDEIPWKDYTLEDSGEKHHRLRIHLPKATDLLCWTTQLDPRTRWFLLLPGYGSASSLGSG